MGDFQRRHYVKLAEFWKDELANSGNEYKYWAYKNFVTFLMSDNPMFKPDRFHKAAGYTDA